MNEPPSTKRPSRQADDTVEEPTEAASLEVSPEGVAVTAQGKSAEDVTNRILQMGALAMWALGPTTFAYLLPQSGWAAAMVGLGAWWFAALVGPRALPQVKSG